MNFLVPALDTAHRNLLLALPDSGKYTPNPFGSFSRTRDQVYRLGAGNSEQPQRQTDPRIDLVGAAFTTIACDSYRLLLAESHLTRRLFGAMLQQIAALPSPVG